MRNVAVTILVLVGLGVCLMVLSRTEADPPGPDVSTAEQQPQPLVSEGPEEQAERSFLRGEYEAAARAYQQVVRQDPDDSLAWIRLAYATHELGDFEAAIPLHERAAEFPENRIASLFKLGCALARLDRVDEAIRAMERAVEAGYRDRRRAEQQVDLASLRDDDRFLSLLNRMGPAPPGEAPLDFLVGHWVIRDPDSSRIAGFSSLQRIEDSHLYQEQWNTFRGGLGRGMAFLDPESGTYELVRAFDQGEVHRLKGSLQDGVLNLGGKRVLRSGKTTRLKVIIEPLADGRIRRRFLESEDGGETWQLLDESLLFPEEPAWRIGERR